MNKYLLALSCGLINFVAIAQTIVTDRPDQTESSLTVPQGSLQIESGVLYGTAKDDFFSEELLLAPTVLWRYGITKGIELRFLTEFASVTDKLTEDKFSGINDLQLGTKVQILKKEDVKTEIAFLTHLIIPSAKKELTLDEIGSISKLAIAHDIGDVFGLGYNIGYDYYGFGSGNLTYSLSLGIGLSDKVGMYVEPYGALVNLDNHESNFNTGFTYLVQNNLQLDISAGVGLNNEMNFISVGCSVILPKN